MTEPTPPSLTIKAADSFISIDDFQKVEIKVGTILSVNTIDGADKLYILQVDLGEENHGRFFLVFESLFNQKHFLTSNFLL